MRSEGLLRLVGSGVYLPTDADVSQTSRARCFGPIVPAWGALATEAAAWVHGGPTAQPPFVVVTDRAVGSRTLAEDVRVRESSLHPGDVVRVADVAVTSPARTAADLARWGEGVAAQEAFTWLVRHATTLQAVRSVLAAQTRFRHNRRARERVLAHTSGRTGDLWARTPEPARRPHPAKASDGGRLRPVPVTAATGEAVDVEDAVDASHGREHVAEVGGVAHLERELGDRHAVP